MAEDIKAGKDVSQYQKQIQKFHEELLKAEKDYLISNINVLEESEGTRPVLILDESDRKFMEKYYNYIHATRPVMEKHREDEYDYDMDFEVDTANYDPWKEYQMIYRKVLEKGRMYWLAKALPDWKFLQIARPDAIEHTNIHDNNVKRPNMRDSIFTMIETERYFDERKSKAGLYKGRSQAIRI
jgi:hypothetical protein